MTHSRRALAALAVSASVAAGCRAHEIKRPAQPAISRSCAAALAENTTDRAQKDERLDIARVQEEARGGPKQRQALEQLGLLYVARARITNDPGNYKLAEMAAECLDSQYPGEPAALLLKGHVLHQLHRFQDAEHVARTLVAKREFVLDYGLLGDVLMEQGRLREAADAYQRMIDLKPFYQSYTRAAHLRWLKGDLPGAIELMRLAIGSASPRDTESLAWAWTRLAMYQLQSGRSRDAASSVDRALASEPEYASALLARGRILLAIGRGADAVDVLRRAASLNPLPEYQWILADALRLQHRDEEADVIEQDLQARGASADPRTLALFLATRRIDLAHALTLAEEETHTRADVFTLDAHAWALAANGRVAEAREIMTRALAEGTQDARLFFHAGAIDAAAGRHREAAQWLEKAHALRNTLFPSESTELRRMR